MRWFRCLILPLLVEVLISIHRSQQEQDCLISYSPLPLALALALVLQLVLLTLILLLVVMLDLPPLVDLIFALIQSMLMGMVLAQMLVFVLTLIWVVSSFVLLFLVELLVLVFLLDQKRLFQIQLRRSSSSSSCSPLSSSNLPEPSVEHS